MSTVAAFTIGITMGIALTLAIIGVLIVWAVDNAENPTS